MDIFDKSGWVVDKHTKENGFLIDQDKVFERDWSIA